MVIGTIKSIEELKNEYAEVMDKSINLYKKMDELNEEFEECKKDERIAYQDLMIRILTDKYENIMKELNNFEEYLNQEVTKKEKIDGNIGKYSRYMIYGIINQFNKLKNTINEY